MVHLSTILATAALLSTTTFIHAQQQLLPLDHMHPAYGAELSREAIELNRFRIAALAARASSGLHHTRSLEAAQSDVAILENFFGTPLERNINNLPKTFDISPVPWPGSYWPTYQDGINVKWDGPTSQSASEKYARAFGLDVQQFQNGISAKSGIDGQSGRKTCTTPSDCGDLHDGSTCARRHGATTGYCIPTWFGICHAWSPAAILEPEPKCPVTLNDVTFQPLDIKALMTQIYDGAKIETVFVGQRFNGDDRTSETDKYGRHTDASYRDLNPGFFHIALTNLLSKFNKSFVVDVTAGSQVWNQPVRGYDIVEQTPMNLQEASVKYYNNETYPFNPSAQKIAHVRTAFKYIVESIDNAPLVATGRVDMYTRSVEYEYLLELDASDNIIGGEWLGESNDVHPDFLWFPARQPAADEVTRTGLSYANVKKILQQSVDATC